jgi:CRISPR-associated endonuclease Cas2
MYVILVYDMGERRVVKMLKLCRKYPNWIQNSVFEGEISDVKLKELISRAEEINNMINSAGVSSFYLGKKGLAFVDSIEI